MSGPFGSDQWMYSSGGYEIDQSLRFNDYNNRVGYLSRTPSTVGNRRTYTYSAWMKYNEKNWYHFFLSAYNSGYGTSFLMLQAGS